MNFSVKNFFSKCDDGNYFQGKFYFEGAISGDNFPGGNFPWGQLP